MFQTVLAMQGDYGQAIFWALSVIGGVLGAFLPPLGKMSRLPYLGFFILFYVLTFIFFYSLGSSSSVPLIFWSYLIVGVLSGSFLAWIARARSSDIKGDGSDAFLAFIPLIGLILVFASGKHVGPAKTSKSKSTIVGLVVAGLIGIAGTYGLIELSRGVTAVKFAREVVLNTSVPQRLDSVTTLIEAKAAGNRVKLHYLVEGQTAVMSEEALQGIKSNICKNHEVRVLFEEAGVEREFIYLDDKRNILGSFVAGC